MIDSLHTITDTLTTVASDSLSTLADTLAKGAQVAQGAATEWIHLPDIALQNTGFVGDDYVTPFFRTDIMSVIFFVYLLGASWIVHSLRQSRRSVNDPDSTDNDDITLSDTLRSITLFVLSTAGYSMTLCRLLGGSSWGEVAICAAAFTAFLLIKYGCLELFLWTFYGRDQSGFAKRYIQSVNYFGLCTMAIFFALNYTPDSLIWPLYIVLGTCALGLCGFLLWIFFGTFFRESRSVLCFILYLCTLEILPLLILGKFLYETGALTNL